MKKILVNLLILLLLFGIVEGASYIYLRNKVGDYLTDVNNFAKQNKLPTWSLKYAPVRVFHVDLRSEQFRPTTKGDRDESIIFFGCSYMYGYKEKYENTIPYIVAKETGITTVNRAFPGGSIVDAIDTMENPEFYNYMKKVPKPKYVIFMFITDHLNRVVVPYRRIIRSADNPYYEVNPKYEIENEHVKFKKYSKLNLFFKSLYSVKAFYYLYASKFNDKKAPDVMYDLFVLARHMAAERYPGAKFIIIDYKDGGHLLMPDELMKKLKANDFLIFDAEKLAGHELESEKWRIPEDKEHPNGAAFHDVAMGLVKALNLKSD